MSTDELTVITTYFNPYGFKSRKVNYDVFLKGIQDAGVRCLTIEWAMDGHDFELPEGPDVMHIRCNTLLWQKERMINLAAATLPDSCKYVAWLDADIIFENTNWVADTLRVMKTCNVAQMFEVAENLPAPDAVNPAIEEHTSFASVVSKSKSVLYQNVYHIHGHTGYGWVARKELFDKVGLYEYSITGSSDHYMAHAFVNVWSSGCLQIQMCRNENLFNHFVEWAERANEVIKGSLGVVPGRIKHLWHGTTPNRQYGQRNKVVNSLGFNPYTDLKIVPGELIQWADNFNKPMLANYFQYYFIGRLEDG